VALEPLERPQLVHGDLTGNVLFARGQPPAIIDISPYWRPPSYAEGIIVADALAWHGAPASVVNSLGVPVAAAARALLFRMATATERLSDVGGQDADISDEAERYAVAATSLGL